MNTGASAADVELWRRARQLFLEVSTLPAHERDAWLRGSDSDADVIAAVHRLLAHEHEATGAMAAVPPEAIADALRAVLGRAEREFEPALADFRIERTLGEGGMGRVYLAVRDTGGVTQRVALKVVPLASSGPRLIEQLRRERTILAGLEHPHIARLIDAGELPDGSPYFAMEYVDGVPLTDYCDDAALDLQSRIALLLDVCDAVAHAHRRFVLHRDLKASNILVDGEARVRLLDFGIAKSLDQGARDTTLGQNWFSLRNAAPEQILGTATTIATDVYGLGCLLYELLSGRLPFESDAGSGEQLLRRIVEDPPPLVSVAVTQGGDAQAAGRRGFATTHALAQALRGDLDQIVARALRKRPAERYASVEEFAADLRSVLELRPIAARTSERWYRLRMLLRRHRLTAIVTMVLGLAVIAATALSIVQSLRAVAERDRAIAALAAAQLQRDHAQRVTAFLVNAFRSPDPTAGKVSEMRATDMLDRAGAMLEKDSATLSPALHATIAQSLAHIFHQLQRPAETQRYTQSARRQIERIADPPVALLAHQDLAEAESAYQANRYADAAAATERGLARIADPRTFEDSALLHQLWSTRLNVISNAGNNAAAIRVADEALAVLQSLTERNRAVIDAIRQRRAATISATGDFAAALPPLEQLRDEQVAAGRTGDSVYIDTLRLLGQTYSRLNDYPASIVAYDEAIARHQALYGEENTRLTMLLTGAANTYSLAGRNLEAMQMFRRSVVLTRRYYGDVSLFTSNAYFYGALRLYDRVGDIDQAIEWMVKAAASTPPEGRSNLSFAHAGLGKLLLLRERWFEAGHYLDAAQPVFLELYKKGDAVDGLATSQAYLRLRRYDIDGALRSADSSTLARVLADSGISAHLREQVELLQKFHGTAAAADVTIPLRR